ncbi:hypothetical protein ACFC1B_23210 [Streptomyces xiamenensis]|uniref:hypothetical protein n=1 Tax=Streptomyces xiamenensis TaxID=408015 RepID=UPI0035D80E94
MANDEEVKEGPELIIWAALGFTVGIVLSVNYAQALGFDADDKLPAMQVFIVAALLLGPLAGFLMIGTQLRQEVERGKITWATYWTTVFGISATVLALLGITGVDDLFEVWEIAF